MSRGKKLAQTQAAELLIEGKSISTTARELGLHRATLHRWLKTPDFQEKLRRARRPDSPRPKLKHERWYEASDTEREMHRRVMELLPGADPDDARLLLVAESEEDPELAQLRARLARERSTGLEYKKDKEAGDADQA